MNFTLDDTASQLVYTGWAAQSPTDATASMFFGGTYHVAQVNGATVNMSVDGGAFYIYGSMGPEHGRFSVQVDDTIAYFSANASDTLFQQLLFSTTFDPQQPSPHFVSLTAILDEKSRWLDVDFVTTSSTNTSTSTVTALPNTLSPPWQATHTAIATSSPTIDNIPIDTSVAGGVANQTSHADKRNMIAEVLAIVFGSLIFLSILLVSVWLFLRRRYDRRHAKERHFRVGNTGAGPKTHMKSASQKLVISAPMQFQHVAAHTDSSSAVHLLAGGRAVTSSPSGLPLGELATAVIRSLPPDVSHYDGRQPSRPPSPGFGTLVSSSSFTLASASDGLKAPDAGGKVPAAASQDGGYVHPVGVRAGVVPVDARGFSDQTHPTSFAPRTRAPKPLAFLTSAPSAFGNLFQRTSKGDADSMKTNFLQV